MVNLNKALIQIPARRRSAQISLWIKVPATCFLSVLVPVYWVTLGPANFLWFSDIALIMVTAALWFESRFLASMTAIGVLLPELAWNLDFFFRLVTGHHLFGLGGTGYMFDSQLPWRIRALSLLFHLYLPVILIWAIYRLGYHGKAWIGQTALAWVVLPLCYWFTDPVANINWVFGPGGKPQEWLPGSVYVASLMIFFPVAIYIPTHLLLNRLFGTHKG